MKSLDQEFIQERETLLLEHDLGEFEFRSAKIWNPLLYRNINCDLCVLKLDQTRIRSVFTNGCIIHCINRQNGSRRNRSRQNGNNSLKHTVNT